MAYCKIHLYAELLDSDLPEDPYLAHDLERYFPPPLPERYGAQMRAHRLRREIIATVVANQLVDRAGTTFAFRLGEETGAPPSLLARAFAVAREVYEMRGVLGGRSRRSTTRSRRRTLLSMLIEARRLVERATRWLVRANPASIDIERTVARYAAGARAAVERASRDARSDRPGRYDARAGELLAAGVGRELARRVASMPSMLQVFDIVEVSNATGVDQEPSSRRSSDSVRGCGSTGCGTGSSSCPRNNRWQALARAALCDDLGT